MKALLDWIQERQQHAPSEIAKDVMGRVKARRGMVGIIEYMMANGYNDDLIARLTKCSHADIAALRDKDEIEDVPV